MTNTGDVQHFNKAFAGPAEMAKALPECMFSVQHVKSPETMSEQLSYVLETVQQYEDECLLSSRNQEEAKREDPLVSVQRLLSALSFKASQCCRKCRKLGCSIQTAVIIQVDETGSPAEERYSSAETAQLLEVTADTRQPILPELYSASHAVSKLGAALSSLLPGDVIRDFPVRSGMLDTAGIALFKLHRDHITPQQLRIQSMQHACSTA